MNEIPAAHPDSKIWLKTLSRNTRVILCGMDLSAAYQPGCNLQTAERALPLKKAHIESQRSRQPHARQLAQGEESAAGRTPAPSPDIIAVIDSANMTATQ